MTQKELMKFMFVGGFLTARHTATEMNQRCSTRTEYGIDIESEIVNREYANFETEMIEKGLI
jgi:hypothetical protein